MGPYRTFLLILFVIGFGWSIHEPRPDPNPSAEADALARKNATGRS